MTMIQTSHNFSLGECGTRGSRGRRQRQALVFALVLALLSQLTFARVAEALQCTMAMAAWEHCPQHSDGDSSPQRPLGHDTGHGPSGSSQVPNCTAPAAGGCCIVMAANVHEFAGLGTILETGFNVGAPYIPALQHFPLELLRPPKP